MAQGYENSRFKKHVVEDLRCALCSSVLRNPVRCRGNEHHFCRNCITTYLQHAPNCPTCKDPLTVETLGRPQRTLANLLSSLKISCDNYEHGCREIVELGSLNAHVARCGFSQVPCSNHKCGEMISRRDKRNHENMVCAFRRVNCHFCGQAVLYRNFMQHTCPARNEIRDMKAELREVRTTLQVMQDMIASQAQRLEAISVSSDLKAEVIVAGGWESKSVEIFNVTTKTWRPLSEMNEWRNAASSVLHQGRMLVTGGAKSLRDYLDSVEELNLAQQDGHWAESKIKLPMPSRGHACVVYQNRLYVFGGYNPNECFDTICEIQMTPPYTSTIIARMPQPTGFHGAEIVNGKVYVVGGCTAGSYEDAVDTVVTFDPQMKTCTHLKPLPYPVTSMATATWKDNVVLIGGLDMESNKLNSVVMYNVTTGSHRMLPEMREKRYACTAVTLGDSILVIGGRDENGTALNSAECFNFDTNAWTDFPAMAEARGHPTAVVKYY